MNERLTQVEKDIKLLEEERERLLEDNKCRIGDKIIPVDSSITVLIRVGGNQFALLSGNELYSFLDKVIIVPNYDAWSNPYIPMSTIKKQYPNARKV